MAAVPAWLTLGAGAAAAALIVTATGDVLLLALALAITTGSRAAVGPLLACLALAVRAGSVTLAASAGAQAVLGPAVAGPPLSAASAWVGGVAFVAAARRGPASVPFGLAAGFAVAGPAIASASDLLLRVGAAALGVAVAAGVARWVAPLVPDGARSWTAAAAGTCSFVLAAVA
jgi:hypothetical protein